MKKVMKVLFVLNLLCLVIFLCSCEQKTSSNDSEKAISNINSDELDKNGYYDKKNSYSKSLEIGNVVLEIPEYYDVSANGAGYNISFESIICMAIAEMDGVNTDIVKSKPTAFSDAFEKEMKIVKTEELMVDNNYILKFIGSSEKDTMVFAVLVNDSANKAVVVQYAVDETDPKTKNHYNDFIEMINNAVFKVDDLELVGGIIGTTTRSDGYGFSSYISGVIKNNTDKKYSYVQITFALLDKDGNKVGTALANVNSLDAGETWKFEAIALKDFSTYKLDEITGW